MRRLIQLDKENPSEYCHREKISLWHETHQYPQGNQILHNWQLSEVKWGIAECWLHLKEEPETDQRMK